MVRGGGVGGSAGVTWKYDPVEGYPGSNVDVDIPHVENVPIAVELIMCGNLTPGRTQVPRQCI